MSTHDPASFVSALSQKLATRSRHVCAFLGAGASKACGLPDVAGLEKLVLDGLADPHKTAFKSQLADRNLEEALSRLRRIAALVEGDDRVDGLWREEAVVLDAEVCRLIVEHLGTDGTNLEPALNFAAWAGRTDYQLPLEVFTVNYDLVLETALETLRVPYFDGFVGSLRGRFHTDLVESARSDQDAWLPRFLVRLWKLHGSINWEWEREGFPEIVRLGAPVGGASPAAIFPSDSKYQESRRVPFMVLHDRFRRALLENETLALVSGYSWEDEHLNELLFDSLRRRPRSEVIAFCYSSIPDSLAERAKRTPNLQVTGPTEAVLSGVRGDWEVRSKPPDDVWVGDRFSLGDFAALATFLSRSSPPDGELEGRLKSALLALLGTGATTLEIPVESTDG
jgi:hypothetical protein